MTAGQLPAPHVHRPTWAIVPLLTALLIALAAVAVLHLRHHPVLPYRGPAAARFLEQRGQGNDRVVRASCTQVACTVWLKPIRAGAAVPRAQMAQNLAVDAYLIGSMEAPGGAVAASDWRFVLTAPNGVLTADCSHTQVLRLPGEMTPTRLDRTCQTSWRPTA
jgi:hypothetical protein